MLFWCRIKVAVKLLVFKDELRDKNVVIRLVTEGVFSK